MPNQTAYCLGSTAKPGTPDAASHAARVVAAAGNAWTH